MDKLLKVCIYMYLYYLISSRKNVVSYHSVHTSEAYLALRTEPVWISVGFVYNLSPKVKLNTHIDFRVCSTVIQKLSTGIMPVILLENRKKR